LLLLVGISRGIVRILLCVWVALSIVTTHRSASCSKPQHPSAIRQAGTALQTRDPPRTRKVPCIAVSTLCGQPGRTKDLLCSFQPIGLCSSFLLRIPVDFLLFLEYLETALVRKAASEERQRRFAVGWSPCRGL
jgi:hypothetical protein